MLALSVARRPRADTRSAYASDLRRLAAVGSLRRCSAPVPLFADARQGPSPVMSSWMGLGLT